MVLFFLLLSNLPVLAQTGCIASGIPFQTDGSMYMTYNASTGYYDLYGMRTVNPYAMYCVNNTGRSCYVRGLGLYNGTEVSFGPLPCAIDSFIYPVLICLGLCYVFKISKLYS